VGAIGTTLSIRRLNDSAESPEDLHGRLWDKVDRVIRAMVTGYAGEQVLAYYLSTTASDGFGDGHWRASETSLSFVFTDSAGLCSMSSYAALHWLEVVLATEWSVHDMACDAGWEITSVPEITDRWLLEARTPTLVELRENLYVVSRSLRGATLTDDDFHSDDGIPKPTLAELTPSERLTLEAAAYSGACTCELCRNTLLDVLPSAWFDGRIEDVPATWALLNEGHHDEDVLRTALADFTEDDWDVEELGPPELRAFREVLAVRGLQPPLARVVPMLIQRGRG
jgi:hypothetical protein